MQPNLKTIELEGRTIAPSKIICIGRNYVEHIAELGNEVPDHMVVFLKPNTAIGAELVAVRGEPIHYEAEICFLVEGGRFVAAGVGLDLTKRALQSKLKAKGLPWERAKAFDGSALFAAFVSLGGSVATESLELNRPADTATAPQLGVVLEIDGRVAQSGTVTHMLYKPETILAQLQTFMTLCDGDIVMTGTPKGVGKVDAGSTYAAKLICGSEVLTQQVWVAT